VVLGTRLRRARLFHPAGDVYGGVASVVPGGRFEATANRLAGAVLVRLSGATWKHSRRWPDVLGIAVRFQGTAAAPHPPGPDHQDLLFISSRSLWLLPVAVFTTDTGDFLANTYFAGPRFVIDGIGKAWLRLVPARRREVTGDRRARLSAAVAQGDAVLILEARHGARNWAPVVAITLSAAADCDQGQLHFSPFHDGGGIHPAGFTHHVRRLTYAAARRTRATLS
jgi:hypothetical protein